jgi:hypothetical protein
MKDALGNPIVVGEKYIYTLKSSGNFTVRTGIAKKINTKTITFEILSSHYKFDGDRTLKESYPPAKAQVKPYALIPLVEKKIEIETLPLEGNNDPLMSDVAWAHQQLIKASKVPAKFFENKEKTEATESHVIDEYYKTRGY